MKKPLSRLHPGHTERDSLSTFSVSPFGTFGIIWSETAIGTRIHRIVLPEESERADGRQPRNLQLQTSAAIELIIKEIVHFLKGHDVCFHLNILALEDRPRFQQRVLLAEYGIPRGWTSTYGRIARHIDVSQGARAVGHALATNPFPIIIPCHRAIRSDGRLGGFQGGQDMKRKLLELEGIHCSREGRVLTDRIWY
jgi:methylated-DNA-[protein]-cysteine S-methyltransferase